MPEQKREPKSLSDWKEEIRLAIRYRSIFGLSKQWERYKLMTRCIWDKKIVPVNIMYATVRSLIPQIYFRNPRVSVNANRPGFGLHSRVVEKIDNILIERTKLKKELKTNILDCFWGGRGPGIIGYDSEFGFKSSAYDTGLSGYDKKGNKIEYSDNVIPGMPWYLRCSPSDFLVPWGARRADSLPWFAFRVMRPLRDTKADSVLKNTSGLQATFKSRLDGTSDSGSGGKPDLLGESVNAQYVEMFEIHDLREGKVKVLSLDHSSWLRDEMDDLQFDNLPCEVLGFNEDPDYFWWTPDARVLEVQQLELNDIRTMAKRHRRVALLKVLYDKHGIKDEELNKLLDSDPKAAVGIDVGTGGDIRKAVATMQSHVPPDFRAAAMEVREDLREEIGFSRNQMGSFEAPSGRRTAREADIVNSASMIRIDERRDIVADHMTEIIKKWNQIIFSNWKADRVVDIIGDDGKRHWIRFNGEDIKSDLTYSINPEEAIPQDKRTRRQEAQQFVEMATKIPGINMTYVLQEYARTFDWLDPTQLFPREGAGNNPEQAIPFHQFLARNPQMGGR